MILSFCASVKSLFSKAGIISSDGFDFIPWITTLQPESST
jgi:hypothetical protein